jgi:hypothetical protein
MCYHIASIVFCLVSSLKISPKELGMLKLLSLWFTSFSDTRYKNKKQQHSLLQFIVSVSIKYVMLSIIITSVIVMNVMAS